MSEGAMERLTKALEDNTAALLGIHAKAAAGGKPAAASAGGGKPAAAGGKGKGGGAKKITVDDVVAVAKDYLTGATDKADAAERKANVKKVAEYFDCEKLSEIGDDNAVEAMELIKTLEDGGEPDFGDGDESGESPI